MDENNGFNGENQQYDSQNQVNQNSQSFNDAQNTQYTSNDQNNQYSQNTQYNSGTQFNSNYDPNANQYNGYSNNQQYVSGPGVDDGKNWSIAGLCCGISGIVLSGIPYFGFVVLIAAILGIVFGVKGRKLSTMAYGKPSSLATAGLILGIVGTAWAAICVILVTTCLSAACSLAAFS